MACPESRHCYLRPSGKQVLGVSPVEPWLLVPQLTVLFGLEDGLHFRVAGRPIYLRFYCAFLYQRVSSHICRHIECWEMYCRVTAWLLLLLLRSTAVQVRSSVRLISQIQPSGRGLPQSPTAWSPDQHHTAMLADVCRHIFDRTRGHGLG